jgi:TctA family transporter
MLESMLNGLLQTLQWKSMLMIVLAVPIGMFFGAVPGLGGKLGISLVGMDPQTGIVRFGFGQLFLWDGVDLITIVVGIFALAEMMELGVKGGAIADTDESTGEGYTLSSCSRLILRARCFTTVSDRVTCPSPPMATWPSCRTVRIVVECVMGIPQGCSRGYAGDYTR